MKKLILLLLFISMIGLASATPTINVTTSIPIDYHRLNNNLLLSVNFTDVAIDTCWYDYSGTNITTACNGTGSAISSHGITLGSSQGGVAQVEGNRILANERTQLTSVTKHTSSTAAYVFLTTNANGTGVVETSEFSGDIATFTSVLDPGTYYLVTNASSHTLRFNNTANDWPYNDNNPIEWTGSVANGVAGVGGGFRNWLSLNTTSQLALNITDFTNSNITLYANDSSNNLTTTFFDWDYKLFSHSQTFNSSTFETESETFSELLTTLNTISSAKLIYNAISQGAATVASLGGNNFTVTESFAIPVIGAASISFNWNMTTNSEEISSTVDTQIVGDLNMSICGGDGGSVPFINFTFKNETTDQEDITAEITSSNFSFWLGSGDVQKSFIYSNSTENPSYAFCATPAFETFNTDLTLNYKNTGTQQRTFNPSTLALTNTTTNQLLYLLPTTDGIFVTFQVINTAEQPVANTEITISRAGFGTITQVNTGASGTASVFLNPNFPYTISVSATGFETFTTTQTFPTTEFTIILGLSTGAGANSTLRGMTWTVGPTDSILVNNTNYEFNFTVGTSFWNIDQWGFRLLNENKTLMGLNSSITPVTGGTVSITNSTGDNRVIYMDWFYVVNSTYVNGTHVWGVDVPATGSVAGFFQRLTTYMAGGLLGSGGAGGNSTNFNWSLIIFLIMFIFIGGLSFKFGLNSPEALMMIAVFVVGLFDLGFNLINFNGAVRGFPTVLAFAIFVALFLRRNQ